MKTTTLGKSEFHVSRIAFGTWQLGGDWDSFDEDAAIATKPAVILVDIDLGSENGLDLVEQPGGGFPAQIRPVG
jgi:hypothetical protein